MTSLIPSTQSSQPIISVLNAVKATTPTPLISLMIGENLDARVLAHDRDHRVLLQIKNTPLIADTQIPLQTGDKLTVRVDQLHPNIVLRIISREDADIIKANEFIKLFRSNPGAFKDMIVSVKDILGGENLKELLNDTADKGVQRLNKMLDHIIISKTNATNPLFVKDYITALGLSLERRLMKALSNPVSLKEEGHGHSLKEILLKLSSELQTIQGTRGSAELDLSKKMGQFSNIIDQALKVIESLQVVNVLAQEQDNLFLFQIPLQYPDGVRMQDIFIETDREKNGQNTGKSYRVVLFLDMDALGELSVDAGVKGRSLRCTIKCRNQDVLDFMSVLLPELQEKLSGAGYDACNLQCALEGDIQSWNHEFLVEHKLFSQNIINMCV